MALNALSALVLLFFTEVHPLQLPSDVSVKSYNMGPVVMTWQPPHGSHSNLTYTAQYKTLLRNEPPSAVCVMIRERRCDFGLLNYHAWYQFSVRAELAGQTRLKMSKWKTVKFFMERDTAIGPPSVALVSQGGSIGVSIQDPVLQNAALRDVYTTVLYWIRYWDEGQPTDVKKKDMTVSEKLVKLRPLVPNTKYCVQVQVYIDEYKIKGEESKTKCEMSSSTEDGKLVLSWVMVAVAVAVPLLLLLSWSLYRARRFLNPKDPLPEHFKQRHGVPPSQATGATPEKYDQIWALCEEERPYHHVRDDSASEDHLSLSDSGILEETPRYHNAGEMDMAYEHTPHEHHSP